MKRAWWIFGLPESIAAVPAESATLAREALRKNSYKGAPVETWPLLGSLCLTREEIARFKLSGLVRFLAPLWGRA